MVFALYIPTLKRSDPLDGNLDEAGRSMDRTPDGGDGIGGFLCGRPVNAALMPTKMRWHGRGSKLPDFDNSRCKNVSSRAKDLIEAFEPDVHQFIPVDYYNLRKVFLERRFFMIPCNRIDSLDHRLTTFVLYQGAYFTYWRPVPDLVRGGEASLIPPHLPHDTMSRFVFNRDQIAGRHLWCDKFGPEGPWLSDDLAQAIVDAKLTGVTLSGPIETV